MKKNTIKLFCFFVLLSSVSIALPYAQSVQSGEDSTKTLQNLIKKSDSLKNETDALLKRVRKMRVDELEKMRIDVLDKIQEWEDEEADFDGQALQVVLQNAYFVAEGYGMDVPRLKKLYELTKRVIRRAEFPQFCGSGMGTMKEFTEPVEDSAVIGNVVHFFDLVDKKEERMACIQKHKVRLYKEINREFLRALSTPDPASAAEAFRKYADAVALQVTGQEVEALQVDLKELADEQANVALFFSIIPLVGDAMDAMAIKEGEDISGQKLSAMEKSFAAVMLLMPNALEMVVKRLAKGSAETVRWVVGYLREVADTKGTMLNAAAKKSGTSVDIVKQKSSHMLDLLGNTEAGRVVTEVGEKTIQKVVTNADVAVKSLKEAMPTLTGFANRSDAIMKSNMVTSHGEAFSSVAKARNEIIMVRPVNPHAKALLEEGSAVAKGMHIKGKSSDMPFLEGHIPVDQAHSKLGTAMEEVEKELRAAKKAGDKAKIKELKAAKKKIKADVTEYNNKVLESIKGGHAKASTLKINGQELLSVKNPTTGKKYMVLPDGKGGFLDPNTGKALTHDHSTGAKLSGNWGTPNKARVLVDKRTGKPFTADYDLMGVGSSANMGEVVFEEKSLGNITRGEFDTSDSLNYAVKKKGYQGRVVEHGPATRFHDVPDFPITAYLPTGDVVNVENMSDLKTFFHTMKKHGYNGLDPDSAWGWGEYDPKKGWK